MMDRLTASVSTAALGVLLLGATAHAQDSGADLMSLDKSSLRGAIQTRYDEALGLTQDQAIIAGNDDRFTWASQAKAQCGIALGFLKSGTRDLVSIGKCADAALRMRAATPPAVVAAPPPPSLPEACAQPLAGIVFFDFDSSVVPDSSGPTLDSIVNYTKVCAWQRLAVTGHTDRAGSDAYNDALSVRRAQAVASLLETRGMPAGVLQVVGKGESEPKVPTIDGERNPTNRRVEIAVQ